MSEPKFTRGPWKAHGTQDIDWVETEWKGRNGPANETRETTEYICKCGKSNGFNNSFLIAAAPEMYDFVQFFETFAGQCYCGMLGEAGQKIYDEAVRICKKARGEK